MKKLFLKILFILWDRKRETDEGGTISGGIKFKSTEYWH